MTDQFPLSDSRRFWHGRGTLVLTLNGVWDLECLLGVMRALTVGKILSVGLPQEVNLDSMLGYTVLKLVKELAAIAEGCVPLIRRHMFYVVWTHPSSGGHGSERRIQAVHVEQQGAVITLDQRSNPAAPATGVAQPHWQWDQPIVIQLVMQPFYILSCHFFFPSPLAASWQRSRATKLVGQLELCGVLLHGSCNEQLEGAL